MPERAASRRALAITIVALIAASAMLGGAAMLGWAQLDVQVPLRGIVPVRVSGSAVAPALSSLALLALAAVAAALATPAGARWLLGALLLVAPVVAGRSVVGGMGDGRWLTGVVMSVAELPARAVPVGPARALFAGPALGAGGAALLAAAGIVLVVRGHRMPRLGRRYQAPRAPRPNESPEGRFWERMNAGEDPTASGHPR